MKTVLQFIFLLLISGNIFAQYSFAKSEEFAEIKGRTLIVEQLELDEKLVAKWEKKRDKTNKEDKAAELQAKIDQYTSFVNDYNSLLKKAVQNYWNENPNVIYKTTSEVDQLMKDDSEEYTVLWYDETDSGKRDSNGATYFPNLTVPTLKYSRIEEGRTKTDYCYFINYTHDRDGKIKYSDFILALKMMKQHIAYIVKEDKRKYNFYEYLEDQAKINCGDFSNKKIAVQDEGIHKNTTISELDAAYSGTVTTMTEEEISEAIEQEADQIIGFSFPYGIAKGSIGPVSMGRIQYANSYINVKTGKIFSCFGTSIGQFYDPYFREKAIKKHDDCK